MMSRVPKIFIINRNDKEFFDLQFSNNICDDRMQSGKTKNCFKRIV